MLGGNASKAKGFSSPEFKSLAVVFRFVFLTGIGMGLVSTPHTIEEDSKKQTSADKPDNVI